MENKKAEGQFVELESGSMMPRLAFGTWQIPDGETTYKAVRDALSVGYRHIDTAADYYNEKSVGRAIRESGIPREEIFVTSKVSASVKSYDGAKKAIRESLDNLDIDYLDLFIIHAPWPWDKVGQDFNEQNNEVYRAMEETVDTGEFRNIGLSNFDIPDVQNIMDNCRIKPAVDQIKLYVGNYPGKLVDFCHQNGIVVVGYSTLGTHKTVENEEVKKMAEKYGVTPAQLCIRFSMQHGVVPIVKSLNPQHMKDNMMLDFTISDEDLKKLENLPGVERPKEMATVPYEVM